MKTSHGIIVAGIIFLLWKWILATTSGVAFFSFGVWPPNGISEINSGGASDTISRIF